MNSRLSLNEFKNYFLTNAYNENMFKKDGNINPKYNSFKKTGTLVKIFEGHWGYFYKRHKDGIDRNRHNVPKSN